MQDPRARGELPQRVHGVREVVQVLRRSWLRTNGVNTNGAAAKIMVFDRLVVFPSNRNISVCIVCLLYVRYLFLSSLVISDGDVLDMSEFTATT